MSCASQERDIRLWLTKAAFFFTGDNRPLAVEAVDRDIEEKVGETVESMLVDPGRWRKRRPSIPGAVRLPRHFNALSGSLDET